MSLTHTNKWIVFECDDCDESEQFEVAYFDFDEAWTQLKASGWRTKKIAATWVHGCPKHARDL